MENESELVTVTDSTPFTEQQAREIAAMLALGCDRVTACHYLGYSLAELEMAESHNGALATRLRRAEATAEFAHMRTLSKAAKDPKNWRIAVWWLQRHDPERFASRPPFSLSGKNLERVLAEVAHIIGEEVKQESDQQRLLSRMTDLAHKPPRSAAEGKEGR